MEAVDSIEEGFNLYKENALDMLAGSVVYHLAQAVLGFILFLLLGLGFLLVTLVILGGLERDIASILMSPSALMNTLSQSIVLLIGFGLFALVCFIVYAALIGILTGGFVSFSSGIKDKLAPSISKVLNPPRKASFAAVPFVTGIPVAIVLGITGLILFFIVSSAKYTSSILTFLLPLVLVALIGGIVVLIVAWFLAFTVYSVALDERGAFSGALTSVRFVKNNIGETLLFLFLVFLITIGISFVVGIPLAVLGLVLGLLGKFGALLADVIDSGVRFIVNILITPWLILSMVVFYSRLRGKPKSSKKPGKKEPERKEPEKKSGEPGKSKKPEKAFSQPTKPGASGEEE